MMKSESCLTYIDSNATEMFKDQKSSKGIVKIRAGRYGLRKKSQIFSQKNLIYDLNRFFLLLKIIVSN